MSQDYLVNLKTILQKIFLNLYQQKRLTMQAETLEIVPADRIQEMLHLITT